jgi:hypothetical protein
MSGSPHCCRTFVMRTLERILVSITSSMIPKANWRFVTIIYVQATKVQLIFSFQLNTLSSKQSISLWINIGQWIERCLSSTVGVDVGLSLTPPVHMSKLISRFLHNDLAVHKLFLPSCRPKKSKALASARAGRSQCIPINSKCYICSKDSTRVRMA